MSLGINPPDLTLESISHEKSRTKDRKVTNEPLRTFLDLAFRLNPSQDTEPDSIVGRVKVRFGSQHNPEGWLRSVNDE